MSVEHYAGSSASRTKQTQDMIRPISVFNKETGELKYTFKILRPGLNQIAPVPEPEKVISSSPSK